jgi:acetylornithine deacetylase/succinyl-diaminopimelate desuccinylase-like protein
VVEARKEDWSDGLDPFRLTERDGYYYGRGTLDDKAMAAIFVANLIRYKREGYRPKRDLIVALTADEEGGGHNGVAWLLKHRRDAIEAELGLNEGGGGTWRNGKPFVFGVQVSEKMFLTFDFEATNAGGHSSVPQKDNAIYDLAGAMQRLSALRLPLRLSIVTRLYFAKLGNVESGALAEAIAALVENRATPAQVELISDVPRYNSQLRTTCVATRLEGGHADNALPQRARATVNCRLLPREEPQFVLDELRRIAGERVTVKTRGGATRSEPSDAESPAMKIIQRVAESMWPGVPVVPLMSTGATDGMRLRNAGIPTYGVSGLFVEYGEIRAHGRDERVAVRSFLDGTEYLYRLAKALGSGE